MAKDIIKNIPLTLDINARKRLDGSIDIRLYSKDIATGQFEFTLVDEDNNPVELDETYSAQTLVKYEDEEKTYLDDMIIEGNIIRFIFPHDFITKDGIVTMYIYITKDSYTSDVAAISFNVYRSEIDDVATDIVAAYDKNYEDILEEFKQTLEDYKSTLPKADSVRAEIDEVLNKFSEDSQAKLSQYDTDVQQVITDINEAESSRVEAEGQRDSAETIRVQSESQRVSAESNRVNAESERVLAEQERSQGYQEIQQMIEDGALNVEPKDGSVTTEKLADKAITPDKTSFVRLDPRNLVDPKTLTYNTRFDTGGNEMVDARYDATDYIPVTEGTYIIATPDVLETVSKSSRVPFYDKDKNFVSIVADGISASAIMMTAEIPYDGYIRVPIKKIFLHNLVVAKDGTYAGYYDHVYISDARSQPLIASVGQDELIDKSVSVDKTNFIALGKNLFDKTNVDLDSFYTNPPRTTPLSGYFTIKEPIELEANTTYTMTNVRQWQLIYYDGTDTSVTNTSNNAATVTFTTTGRCVLYMSGSMSNLDVTQLEVGDESTAYAPYGFYFPSLKLTDEQKSGQGGTTPSPTPLVEKDINVTKRSELFTLSSDLDGKPIVMVTERQGRDNDIFNFRSTSIDGDTIHGNSDDVAPIRTFTTVGANHGYTTIIIVTMENHGKSLVDRGSVWTDGTTEYTLLRVAGDNLTFACPYSVDSDGVVSSRSINPSGSLTHVSGATNTQSVDVTNRTGGQLYPSVNNQKVDYVLDGKVLTGDGTYSGDTLQVVESYRIMDYKDIIDWSRANIGEAFANDDIESVVEIKNIYTFTKGLRISTSHSLTAIKPVSLMRCGFLQAVAIGLSGHKTIRTMPGVSVDGCTFDVGQDLTDYNTNLLITDGHLKDSITPPSYYTDWLVDSENNRKYGFSMGYIPDKTNSKNSDRLQNSSIYWDLRSSRKSYPVAVEGITLEAGEYLSFSGFRQYLTPESNDVTNFIVRDTRDAYVYSDYSSAQNHVEVSSNRDIGKKIEVLQSENYTSVNDSVDVSGVVYKTTGVGGAIVKLD